MLFRTHSSEGRSSPACPPRYIPRRRTHTVDAAYTRPTCNNRTTPTHVNYTSTKHEISRSRRRFNTEIKQR